MSLNYKKRYSAKARARLFDALRFGYSLTGFDFLLKFLFTSKKEVKNQLNYNDISS